MSAYQERFAAQRFNNGYELVNGVAMHAENPEHFHIPPPVIKRHVQIGHFVELRIDSPRFSLHLEEGEQCMCPSCQGPMSKPVLRHEQPASFVATDRPQIPARGWGEDFWVKISGRSDVILEGQVDNTLIESRLHGLERGSEILFHVDHILAVHPIHRREMLLSMNDEEIQELARWLGRV